MGLLASWLTENECEISFLIIKSNLIYELIEIILFEKDQLMALFMSVSLLKHFKNEILELKTIEALLPFLQKKLKVDNIRDL